MTHVITSLCLRDNGCLAVCPVECIMPGDSVSEWPTFYIDPSTCIDCGACVPACPVAAIYESHDATPSHQKDLIPANDVYRNGDADTMAGGVGIHRW